MNFPWIKKNSETIPQIRHFQKFNNEKMGKKFETFNNGCFSSRCYLKNNPSVIQDIFGKIQHKITLYKTSVTQEL